MTPTNQVQRELDRLDRRLALKEGAMCLVTVAALLTTALLVWHAYEGRKGAGKGSGKSTNRSAILIMGTGTNNTRAYDDSRSNISVYVIHDGKIVQPLKGRKGEL